MHASCLFIGLDFYFSPGQTSTSVGKSPLLNSSEGRSCRKSVLVLFCFYFDYVDMCQPLFNTCIFNVQVSFFFAVDLREIIFNNTCDTFICVLESRIFQRGRSRY